jgi:hypothetical protein
MEPRYIIHGNALAEMRHGVRCQSAGVVLRPQTDRPARFDQLATQAERGRIEEGRDSAKREFRHLRPRKIPAQEIEKQRRDQRAVHDQAGIGFGLGAI